MKINTNIFIPLIFLILLIISRMLSDIPNFTPTISLIIFAGFYMQNRISAALVVLFSQLISDFFIGFYDSMIFVYMALIFIVYLSPIIIRKLNVVSVVAASTLSPSIFFIVSNFGVWFLSSTYEKDLNGLILCYYLAIPFFTKTLTSTIFFSYVAYFANYSLKKKLA